MTTSDRWFRFSLRTIFVLVTLAALVSLYVGSYCQLSRRGMREAKEVDLEGFLYVPFEEALITEDLSEHHRLANIYAPLNWIDRTFFGGVGPTQGIMWRLSDQRSAQPTNPRSDA